MNMFSVFITLLVVINKDVSCFRNGNYYPGSERFTPEVVIHQLSELARYLIKSGNVAKEVPVLDPYEFQLHQFNFTGRIFSGHVNFTNGNLTGLGDFQLQQFNFSKSEVAVELNVNIPTLRSHSEYYKLDGNIYEALPIMGQGMLNFEVHNLSLWGKVYLKQSADGKAILLDKIDNPQFSIDRIVSRTQFDNNIDAIISAMVEDLAAGYLTRFNKFISATYSDSLVQFLNNTLMKFETWSVIAVILSVFN